MTLLLHSPIWLAENEQRYCLAYFLLGHANGTIWQLASGGRRDGLVSLHVSVGTRRRRRWRRRRRSERELHVGIASIGRKGQKKQTKKRRCSVSLTRQRAEHRFFWGIVSVQLFEQPCCSTTVVGAGAQGAVKSISLDQNSLHLGETPPSVTGGTLDFTRFCSLRYKHL